MELTLSSEEQEFLAKVLEQRHRELLHEIAHTDHRAFRQELLHDEKLFDALILRLQARPVQPTHG